RTTRALPLLAPFPYTTLFRSSISRLLSSLIRPLRLISQNNSTPQPVSLYSGCAFAHLRGLTRTEAEYFVCVIVPDAFNAGEFNKDRKSTRLNSSHVSISYAVF